MAKHKRGGFYTLKVNNIVTNWGGEVLDKKILNFIKVGDIVRILIYRRDYFIKSYIQITHILPDSYFKGFINDPYRLSFCDICNEIGYEKNFLYSCEENGEAPLFQTECNFDCHKKCLEKYPNAKTCNCKLVKRLFQSNEIIIFNKKNIIEIPDWTNNTEKLIQKRF
jgi:hypothetical protein